MDALRDVPSARRRPQALPLRKGPVCVCRVLDESFTHGARTANQSKPADLLTRKRLRHA